MAHTLSGSSHLTARLLRGPHGEARDPVAHVTSGLHPDWTALSLVRSPETMLMV